MVRVYVIVTGRGVSRALIFFAGLDALSPCVVKLRVTIITTVLEPIAAGGTATKFTGFLVGSTFGALAGTSWLGTSWLWHG